MAADLPRYLSVLLLLRAICEVLAAVLVTAAFVRWLGDDWRAVLAALAVVIGLRYALTGVRPQTGRVGPRTERTAERAAAFLFPLTRALRLAVAMAVSSGAQKLEAAALVSDADLDPGDLAVVRDLGPDATVFHAAPDGTVRETLTP